MMLRCVRPSATPRRSRKTISLSFGEKTGGDPLGFVELLGQPDDDAFGAAHIAEAVLVFVLGDFAHEFGSVGAEAVEDFVDVVDGEHDAADPQGIHRRFLGSVTGGLGRDEFREFDAAVAVGGPHHGDIVLDVLEPHDAVHPLSLDARLALQLHTELREKRLRSFEILDHDEDVVHSLDRHGRIN